MRVNTDSTRHRLRAWYFDHADVDRTILIVAGNRGNVSHRLPFARFLHRARFDVFLFDYQGFGESAGDVSVASLLSDSLAAFDTLVREKKKSPSQIGIYGLQLGSPLALRVAGRRKAGAVAAENLYSPEKELARLEKSLILEPEQKIEVQSLKRFLLPSVDPAKSAGQFDGPLFLIHGRESELVGGTSTFEVAHLRPERTRLWLPTDAGISPEPLSSNDREYEHQVTSFFEAALGPAPTAPELDWSSQPNRDGFEVKLQIGKLENESGALEIVFVGDAGQTHVERRRIEKSGSTWTTQLKFQAKSAWPTWYRYTKPQRDGWIEDRSAFSHSYLDYLDFEEKFSEIPNAGFTTVGESQNIVRGYSSRHWRWVAERLPDLKDVHPRVRPMYARLCAHVQIGQVAVLKGKDRLAAAEAMLTYLPIDAASHYELRDGLSLHEFRDAAVSEACFLLARRRLRKGEVDKAKSLLRRHLATLPSSLAPRITEEQIDKIGAK
ncbi:MAG: hypothetical protein AAF517_05995 [Planctomycetota bacterium]